MPVDALDRVRSDVMCKLKQTTEVAAITDAVKDRAEEAGSIMEPKLLLKSFPAFMQQNIPVFSLSYLLVS